MFREDFTTTEQIPITYSLQLGAGNSNAYYQDVSQLVSRVIQFRDREIRSLLDTYMTWILESGQESLRDEREYTFDILTLGVLWRQYGSRVRRVSRSAAELSSMLYRLRRRCPALKQTLDSMRGWISSRYLAGDDFPDRSDEIPSCRDLGHLLRWMRATGEYREETLRLRILVRYLRRCIREERDWYLEHVLNFEKQFERDAENQLGHRRLK
jgi:hypothetical protein